MFRKFILLALYLLFAFITFIVLICSASVFLSFLINFCSSLVVFLFNAWLYALSITDNNGLLYHILVYLFYPINEFPSFEVMYLSPIKIFPTSGLDLFYVQISCLALLKIFSPSFVKKLNHILSHLDKTSGELNLDTSDDDWALLVRCNLILLLVAFVLMLITKDGEEGYIDLICIPVTLSVIINFTYPSAAKEVSNVSFVDFLKNSYYYLWQVLTKSDVGSKQHHSKAILYMAYCQLSLILCYLVYGSKLFINTVFVSALFTSIGFFVFILKLIDKIPMLRMGKYGYINIFIISISTVVYISFVSSIINDIYSISGSYFPNTILAMTAFGFSMIFHNLFSNAYIVAITLGLLTFWIIPKNYIRKITSGDCKPTEYKDNNLPFKVSLVLFVLIMTLFSDHFETKYRGVIVVVSYFLDFENKHSCSNFEIKNHEKLIELKDGRFYIFDINNEVAFIEECKRKEVIEINKG